MIKIEISADTTGEVLQHIIELANGLLAGGGMPAAENHDPVTPELRAAQLSDQAGGDAPVDDKPKRTRRTKEQIAADEAAAAAAQSAEGNVAEVEVAETQNDPVDVAEKTTSDPVAPSDAPLDFDKDVAPKVLAYVKERGKEFVVGVLSQFGAARASELAAEQWPELLTALDDASAV